MQTRLFKRVACVDFETYFDKDFTLTKLSTSQYVRDPRFYVTAVAIQMDNERHARVYHGRDAERALREIDWTVTALLAHHTHFDGFILAEIFGIIPCFYLDTLSMGRALHGVFQRHGLGVYAKLYGLEEKDHGALLNMKGVEDIEDLTPTDFGRFIEYTGEDAEKTWALFDFMSPHVPIPMLRLIDFTILMFTQPRVLIQEHIVERVHAHELERKVQLLEAAGVTRKQLGSTTQFVALLRAAGVEPEEKISKRTGLLIPAISMQDVSFKVLREHPDERVRELVEARIAVKSSLLETRSKAMLDRARINKTFPVYLKPFGAHTMRWSGGDKVNPQNLIRGSGLREAMQAPGGYLFNIADSSQIEARLNAWRARQTDIVETFRAKKDVYRFVAARTLYHKPEDEITKTERFVGKTAVLGLGYGMGPPKLKHTLKIGQFGPPIDKTLEECKDVVDAWRASNMAIVKSWYDTENMAKSAFLGEREYNDGLLIFEGFKGDGYVHMPNGLYLKYPRIRREEDDRGRDGMTYATRMGATRLWGGLLVENIIQCLAFIVVAEQMLQVQDEIDCYFATCTHDEIVALSRTGIAHRNQRLIEGIMSRPPVWAPDVPLGAEGGVAKVYIKPE